MNSAIKPAFQKANFLLPKDQDMTKWAVIACDQYTSDVNYWQQLQQKVQDAPSCLNLILPEVYLDENYQARVEKINQKMIDYLNSDLFAQYEDCYIYLERTLSSGVVRRGIVGVVDMQAYSYKPAEACTIKPTEQTVASRIPPRKAVRDKATLELTHVILFCNDKKGNIFDFLISHQKQMPVLYDFDLMSNGGHVKGYLVNRDLAQEFDTIYQNYAQEMALLKEPELVVGDGNHSLATAKAVYEDDQSNNLARYAMVEVQNIYDEAIVFEPIHRVLYDIDVKNFLTSLDSKNPQDYPITFITKDEDGVIYLPISDKQLPLEVLQPLIDEYLKKHGGEVDYVHSGVEKIVKDKGNCVGLLLSPIAKEEIFNSIATKGVYPRKTFSVGEADDKRFYLEARKIK